MLFSMVPTYIEACAVLRILQIKVVHLGLVVRIDHPDLLEELDACSNHNTSVVCLHHVKAVLKRCMTS